MVTVILITDLNVKNNFQILFMCVSFVYSGPYNEETVPRNEQQWFTIFFLCIKLLLEQLGILMQDKTKYKKIQTNSM